MRRANRRAQRDTITVVPLTEKEKFLFFLLWRISCDHQWRYSCVYTHKGTDKKKDYEFRALKGSKL